MPRSLQVALVVSLAVLGLFVEGCQQDFSSPTAGTPVSTNIGARDQGEFLGAGATFPAVLYQGWFYDYNRLAPGVRVNYQSIGSGAGINQFKEGTVDFGATDAPMSDADLAAAPWTQHLPTVLGAVALSYNLPGLSAPLRLDAEVVAAIFLGQVSRWDDPAIAALNPGAALPADEISVAHRSDSSGTTYVFTDWLNKSSPAWKAALGRSKAPDWPVGIGGLGNEGVANLLRQTPGSIGYVELNYVAALGLPAAEVKNGAGEFIGPSIDAVSAAAAGVTLPEDYRVSLTASASPGAYPISSFTYLLVEREPENCTKARVMFHLLWWMYHDTAASGLARELSYAPLPEPVIERVDQTLLGVTCDGQPLLSAPR